MDFELDGQAFTALNGGPVFRFNEAISLQVRCDTQAEIDYYWEKPSESGITIRHRISGETEHLDPKGIFMFIGLSPNSAWLPGAVNHDHTGFIVTNTALETSIPGVFAAGDVQLGSTKQAASAAGEGATAALMIREYLNRI